MKMNSRIRDFIAVIIIQLIIMLPFYTANVYGLTISDVQVTKVSANSATIEWATDNISNGKVRYGKTTSLGLTQRHENFIYNHTLSLFNGIDSDTTYFFAVESADLEGNIAIDNNSNEFYAFKTKDITPPPKVTGLVALFVTSDSISLYWNNLSINDLKHYAVYRNRVLIANSTTNRFNDTNLTHNTDFSYKVSAVDTSGNEGAQSDTLIASTLQVDSIPPMIIDVDVNAITDTSAKFTWLTNENSTSAVIYGINKTDKAKGLSDLDTNHTVVIDGLIKNAQYIFVVRSCDVAGNCANSSTKSFISQKDTIPPFIDLPMPRFVDRRVLDIIGSTEPFSSVTLFVNNMNVPKRSLSNSEVSSGKFIFSQIQLDQDNIIKIVAVDKSGNKNQKTFEVGVDTENPIVKLNELPAIIPKTNLTIGGSVNELVSIKAFADINSKESSTLQKITGLQATNVSQNYVQLHWDELKDTKFSHYVVYRDEIPIALTKPSNFNLFIDALVDSGISYSYQISTVDIFGRESPKSDAVTATTLAGGKILNLKPPEVDIFEDFRKPLLSINASGNFEFGIKLGKGDGFYDVKLIFEDRAGNSVNIKKLVQLDTKKPEIKIISPPSGAFIFENVANQVDVVGTTKPNSRVHLFVDRTPFSFFNETFEISGLPNEIQDLPESQLDAKCRLNIAAKSFCPTGADFSVSADSQGKFVFKDVDLTAMFGGAGRIREVSPSEIRDTKLEDDRQSKKTALVLIATDQSGQRAFKSQTIRIGTCWSGNQSWDVIPLSKYQSPTLISTQRLVEGTESIYFYFNYSYIGRGISPKIQSISIAKACSTREIVDPRFNLSCQILTAGNSPKLLNPPENTVSYSAIPLNRLPGMDRFLEDDWKSFFKAANKELTFPIKIRIRYQHDTDNDGVLETETQTTCEQLTYELDNSIIDPRKVLPDWLLFNFVDFLQDSIRTLTTVQEQIDKLLDYVAVGCISSFGLNFAFQIYRRWINFFDEKPFAIKSAAKLDEAVDAFRLPNNKENEEDCKDIIKKIAKDRGGFKLKYMTDSDLRKCFPSSASAWQSEANMYQLFRWSCDRVFGHSAPSRWTETKSDSELYNKITSGEGCAVDQSVRGQPLKSEKCRDLITTSFPRLSSYKDTYSLDDKCFRVDSKEGLKRISSLYKLSKNVDSNLYEMDKVTGPSEIEKIYAIKRDEVNYLTAQQKSCSEVCGLDSSKKRDKFTIQGKTAKFVKDKKGNEIGAYCTTVDTCRSLNAKTGEDRFKIIDESGSQLHEVKIAESRGFTNDCFYEDGDPISVVGDSPSQREECCCINSKSAGPSHYYQPDDFAIYDGTKSVHESKVDSATATTTALGAADFDKMKWSYRYYKERFEARGTDGEVHDQYHPNRYTEGRDLPACFGQNNWIYEAFRPESVLTVNPFKQHEASLFCLHLAGISNRLQFIKNLMTSLSTCLIQVRTSGRGDAGACKELFSQYLCGAMWQVIRWFINGCAPVGFGIDTEAENENIINYVRAGMTGVYSSVNDMQKQAAQEYGNAKLNELLGTGEESIARKVCLAAFGYDWELNLRTIVDAAYASPFATLVQPVTRSREFLTVDPSSMKPKYEYRSSWIINPGCDFERYDVYLTCVGRRQLDQYPNSVNCGALGAPSIAYTGALGTSTGYSQCDCIELPDERRGPLVFSGRLKQNVLEDKKEFHRVEESNVRYDHLKFVLRPDRKIKANIKPNCFPQGYDDGVFYFPLIDKTARDIFDCRVDPASGTFFCGEGATFATRKGVAYFTNIKVNGEDAALGKDLIFAVGEPLNIEVGIFKSGQDKCLRVVLDGLEKEIVGVTLNSSYSYPVFIPSMPFGQLEQIGGSKQGLEIIDLEANNQREVAIYVKFYDMDGSGSINFLSDDEVNVEHERDERGNEVRTKISQSRYYDSNQNAVVISKEGVRFKIVGATLQRTISGKPFFETVKIDNADRDVATVGGTIIIRTPSQITTSPQSQVRQLSLALYNLKQDADAYDFNPDNCNFNDPVIYPDKPQERRIPIRLETRKPKEVALQGPVVKEVSIPKTAKQGSTMTVTATIENPSEVDSVSFTYKGASEIEYTEPMFRKGGGVFEAQISTNLPAGLYSGSFIAISRNPDAKPSRIERQFEIQK